MIGAQVVLAARVLIGLVFAAAAVGKAGSRQRFATFSAALAEWGRAPLVGWSVVAGGLACAEAVTVVLVVIPRTQRLGLFLGAALLVIFCAAIFRSILRGRSLTCRCFGGDGGKLGPRHLVRNGLLAGSACAALAVGTTAPLDPGAAAGTVLLGAVAAVIVIHWDGLAEALRPTAQEG